MTDRILAEVIASSGIGGICILLFMVVLFLSRKRYKAKTRKIAWIMLAISILLPINTLVKPYAFDIKIPDVIIMEYESQSEDNADVLEKEETNNTNAIGADNSEVDNSENVTTLESNTSTLTLYDVAFGVWLIAAIIMSIYYVVGYRRMYRKSKRWSYECSDEIKSKACVISGEIGLKSMPDIRIMKYQEQGPFTIGILKNIVYLPSEDMIGDDLDYILRHELVHCKNRDTALNVMFLVVNILHWFNPLIWLMRYIAENDIEQACDEKVLSGAPLKVRKEYSEVIMAWVEKSGNMTTPISTGYMVGTLFLKWRFDNIFEYKNKRNSKVFITLMCVVIVLSGSMVSVSKSVPVVDRVVTEESITYVNSNIEIDSGIENKTDLDGDGNKDDKVRVMDVTLGDAHFTELFAQIDGEDVTFNIYDGMYSSHIITGDLSGNEKADVVLSREIFGSNYGGIEISILHFENNKWVEYPYDFIHNPDIEEEQPDKFGDVENWWDIDKYIAVTILNENGITFVRFVSLVPDEVDMVRFVDAVYRKNGWYIINVEIIDDYYNSAYKY